MTIKSRLGLFWIFAVLVLSASAYADILSTGGAARPVAFPPSVDFNVFESSFQIRVFGERHDVQLTSNLVVDITNTGTFNATSTLNNGTIPAGTVLNSHLIHMDPVGMPSEGTDGQMTGSVTFANDILGVLVLSPSLDRTDSIFGISGVDYPFDNDRGLLLRANREYVVISADRRTIQVFYVPGARIDEVRVLTRGTSDGNSDLDDEFPVATPDGTDGGGDGDGDGGGDGDGDGGGDGNGGGGFHGTGQNCAGLDDAKIDIVPGNRDNTIHLDGSGTTALIMFSREDFDAPDCVDVNSLTFGRTGDEESYVGCGAWDMNMDGFRDLQCDFVTDDTQFQVGDAEGILKGATVTEREFEFRDRVTVVAARRGVQICSLQEIKMLRLGQSFLIVAKGENIAASRVQIFDLKGHAIFDSGFTSGSQLRWSLRAGGAPLANGVYFYVVSVKGAQGELLHSGVKKFIVLR